MPRQPRIIVPGIPHHVTQRGNRRERVFFSPADYRFYRGLLAVAARDAGAEVWAYCFMPNHVHVILVPHSVDGLSKTFANPHRHYALTINARFGWTGHLWQGRFGSAPMDEEHLLQAFRYISLNPVRAGLVTRAEDWPWSSVRAHVSGKDDELVLVEPALSRCPDFRSLIEEPGSERAFAMLRRSEKTGRPLGAVRLREGDSQLFRDTCRRAGSNAAAGEKVNCHRDHPAATAVKGPMPSQSASISGSGIAAINSRV
jgi:putative transposase